MSKKSVFIMLFSLILVISCSNNGNLRNTSNDKNTYDFFKENIPTVSWNKDSSDEIKSFSADVKIFISDDRFSLTQEYAGSYKLFSKQRGDNTYNRIDMSEDDGTYLRSIISNDSEMIVYDYLTETISGRIPIRSENFPQDMDLICNKSCFGRMNLDDIRITAQKLCLDMTEEEDGVLKISIPSEYFNNDNSIRTKTTLLFDIDSSTLNEIETVDITVEGDVIISTIYPVYYEQKEELIKIGTISVVETKKNSLIEGLEDMEYYDSMEDIPEISLEEYEKMVNYGNVRELENYRPGNPADLSSVVTTVEVYEDIEINNVDDIAFRPLIK